MSTAVAATLDRSSRARVSPTHARYQDSPAIKEAAHGSAAILRGHAGEDVLTIQRALNAAGATPPLAEDGLFGPKTEAALRAFQAQRGLSADGVVGRETVGALLPDLAGGLGDSYGPSAAPAPRAPAHDAPPPQGGLRAGDLARDDQARRLLRDDGAAAVPAPSGPADQRLSQLQSRAVDSARRELDAGVREDPSAGNNRGARVDQYAANARMPLGGEWCGYFAQFNYSQAAQEAGGDFRGSLHSFQKARSFFNYRDYTNNSRARNQQLDGYQAADQQAGSTRRFMVLEGSTGQDWAARNGRPAETYSPENLPIRPGDTVLFNFGHIGMVEGYDPGTGRLTTIEGNAGNRVQRKTYDLNDPRVRARFEGFGRPAAADFEGR